MVAFRLNKDDSFHFELMRQLGHATYHGSDVVEVLRAAGQLTDRSGDFEAFYTVFLELAERVEAYAMASPANTPSQRVSRREAYFRAATYYRAADFYLHGDKDSARIDSLWSKQTTCFNKAIALLNIPGRRETLKSADGSFSVPLIFYSADTARFPGLRPTIIGGNGFDGAQEEMLHVCGFAALERGFNFVSYEGPGQPTVRREQGLGFIHDWERVVTPVVDWLHEQAIELEIDSSKLGLWGHSMGGYLATRAAAFEHRLGAVFAIDGVFDVGAAYLKILPKPLADAYHAGDKAKIDAIGEEMLTAPDVPTTVKWGNTQGPWAMLNEDQPRSVYEFLKATERMTLKDVAHKVQCKVFVGDAEEDIFFKGQPEILAEALGEKAHFKLFTSEDGAGAHCQVGAGLLLNQCVFDWFERVVGGED